MKSSSLSSREKLCKICDDFKSWSREQAKIEPHETLLPEDAPLMRTVTNSKGERIPCPPNKEELGRATWAFLHTMATYYPDQPSEDLQKSTIQFLHSFSRIYPCEYCAEHLKIAMEKDPPQATSQHNLSQWLCSIHNQVNELLNKPVFDCRKLMERWRDGPSDGSCQ